MDSGLYAAYTGLLARTQALDTAANNLANAGTNGFRAQRDTFRGVLASGFSYDEQAAGQVGSQVGQSVNGFGVLGGSPMSNTTTWSITGPITVLIGIVVAVVSWRRLSSK